MVEYFRTGFVVSHPCDRKKSQGWGTEMIYLGSFFCSLFPIPYSLHLSMRQKVNSNTNQHRRGPSPPVHIFLEEDFAGNGVGDQSQRG